MKVGFGEVDITPAPGMPMVGMPGSPRGEDVMWPLSGRICLIDDGEQRVAIISLDVIALFAPKVNELRRRLAAIGGLPPANIMVACSHTHRAPFTSETDDGGSILAVDEQAGSSYFTAIASGLETAMSRAAATIEPATLEFGQAEAPGWAFNRRPIFANGQVGTHGWAWQDDFERMESEPDETVWTLVARRPDGSTIGGLVGFACHPTAMGHDPMYSADYPGVLTETLHERHGGIFAFLLGAAGDTSTPDPTSRDPESGFGPEHTRAMGTALADAAEQAMQVARRVQGERVGVAVEHVQIAQRLATQELVDLARWYLNERPDDLDELAFTRQFYGHDYTFADGKQLGNERHAQEMISMWEWQQGPDAELVETIEVQAMAIGDVALVAFPAEMFTAFGEDLRSRSPFLNTLPVTLANGWHGYVPTVEAFTRGGYEPRFAFPSRLVPEAGEVLVGAALAQLQTLAGLDVTEDGAASPSQAQSGQ